MSLFDEKRKLTDRRAKDDGPPSGYRERRHRLNRRQIEIAEITFHEWIRHFLGFRKRVEAKARTR
jgi:hypothetical protein